MIAKNFTLFMPGKKTKLTRTWKSSRRKFLILHILLNIRIFPLDSSLKINPTASYSNTDFKLIEDFLADGSKRGFLTNSDFLISLSRASVGTFKFKKLKEIVISNSCSLKNISCLMLSTE